MISKKRHYFHGFQIALFSPLHWDLNRFWIQLLVLIVVLSNTSFHNLMARPLVILDDSENFSKVSLNPYLLLLEDPQSSITIQDLLHKPDLNNAFQANGEATPNFGFTKSSYWIRLEIQNQSSQTKWLLQLAYPLMDQVDLYVIQKKRIVSRLQGGDTIEFNRRQIKHRTVLFPVRIGQNQELTICMRFKTDGAMEFPLFWMTESEFHDQSHEEQFIFGLYYGIVLILAFYNLVLFFIIRDASYIYYFFYITGYGCLQFILNGLAFEYLWPGQPWWANHSLTFMIGWTFFWSLQFTRSFLDTPNQLKKTDPVLLILMLLMFGLMLLSFFLDYSLNIVLSGVLVLLFSICVIFAGILRGRDGTIVARYFLLAWLALLIGVSIYSLKGFGILPATFLTEYGLQIGSIIEMSLLSMGLGVKINKINQEKEEARRKVLEISNLNESAQKHLARLETELLKQNIQPHFLLNSINATIVWLQDDPANASKLLETLADELRIMLDYSKKDLIPLQDEIELCRMHLDVMSLRHDKQFILRARNFDGDEPIPPLILHTIIENGLTHGFPNQSKGYFTISVRKSGQSFQIRVFNNGRSANEGNTNRQGLGFQYIESRMNESYGDQWSLSARSVKYGWQVQLDIPLGGS
ncbi:MAG: histidine kinase [Leptospiraceae bacterium]|nr:histidine kinase [Leptospiraceae bacterium]